MIEIKTGTQYQEKLKVNLVVKWAEDEEGNRYKLRRNDGKEFPIAKDIPNELRTQKGLPEFTYVATDIPIKKKKVVENEV